MKRTILYALIGLALMSCEREPNEGIYGTWHKEYAAINGYGYSEHSVTYKRNGTYNVSSYVDGLGTIKCDGKYEYANGILREYDRTEDGQYFEQPRESRVVIDGRKMYVYPNGSNEPTEFHR